MKKLTCIICPNGCHLSIDENTLNVSGNKCDRGKEFAIKELTNPTRTISTIVKTKYKDVPVIPVKVSKEIPKDMIFKVIEEINKITINHPVKTGDVIISNVCKIEGVDVVITSDILKNYRN